MMNRYNSYIAISMIAMLLSCINLVVQASSLPNDIQKKQQLPATSSTKHERSTNPEMTEHARRELVARKLGFFAGQQEVAHTYMDGIRSSETFAGATIEYDEFTEEVMNINYYVQGGPANCTRCLIAIHSGSDCSNRGGRFFTKTDIVKKNPWTKRNGAVVETNEEGTGYGWINNLSNGYILDDNIGHVIVLYDGFRLNAKKARKRAKPIACGVLKKVVSSGPGGPI